MKKYQFPEKTNIKYIKLIFLVILAILLNHAGIYWAYVVWIIFSVWIQDRGVKFGFPYGDILDEFPENTFVTRWYCKWLFWYIYGNDVEHLPRQVVIGTYIRGITFLVHSIYVAVAVWGGLRGLLLAENVDIAIFSYMLRPVIIGVILELIGNISVFKYKFKRLNRYNTKYLAGRFLSMNWRKKEPNATLLGTCNILEVVSKRNKRYAKIQIKTDNKVYKGVLLEKNTNLLEGDTAEVYEICKVQYLK